MITRAEAEAIAARWARGESNQRGYGCEPALAEFDLGFVIWTRPAADVLPIPGDGARTVIDRETGALSTWPGIPPDEIAARYRDRRPPPPRTVDPAVGLRRSVTRRPTPTIAAELIADGRVFRAQGAKGDQQITHHPRLADRLATLPARVRGAERHAELLAASEALYAEVDGGRLTAFHVREPGDPEAGALARPCETCLTVLVDLGFLPRADLAFTTEWRHGSDRVPVPGRFPHEVARVLAGGGWLGASVPASPALAAAEELLGRAASPAAGQVLAEFGGVRCGRRGPGRRRAIRQLTFDPLPGARHAATLAEFGEVIGAPVFPIAIEGGDALLVLDERGRVFALDQAGEWFLGATFDEAITALLTGNGSVARLHDDGGYS